MLQPKILQKNWVLFSLDLEVDLFFIWWLNRARTARDNSFLTWTSSCVLQNTLWLRWYETATVDVEHFLFTARIFNNSLLLIYLSSVNNVLWGFMVRSIEKKPFFRILAKFSIGHWVYKVLKFELRTWSSIEILSLHLNLWRFAGFRTDRFKCSFRFSETTSRALTIEFHLIEMSSSILTLKDLSGFQILAKRHTIIFSRLILRVFRGPLIESEMQDVGFASCLRILWHAYWFFIHICVGCWLQVLALPDELLLNIVV